MASEKCDCPVKMLCVLKLCLSHCDGAGGLLEYPITGSCEGNAGQKKCLTEDTPAAAVQCIFIKSKSSSLVDKSNYSISATSQNAFL